jgi:hypothetical protein
VHDARFILANGLTSPTSITRRLGPAATAMLLVAICAGCAAPLRAGPAQSANNPQAPPDVVYEAWEQNWTLNADGSSVYHEKRHIRLNSDRVFRAFGNPRITFNKDTDEVEVLAARTRLPDGKYVDLADYSTVEVSPDAAAGWPAFANIRELTMVMGGIEPGCVLEVEHKITTKAGARPCVAADLRIDNTYPIRARTVTVSIPQGEELSVAFHGLPEDAYTWSFRQDPAGNTTHHWDFVGLPAAPSEPQSLPWYERGVRLAFTTGPNAETWIKARLAAIDTAADESPLITKLAQEWTKDESTDYDKLKALQKKLAGSFNFVDFAVAWQPPTPRRASDVIRGNYGLPAEAAAAMLSLTRAAGIAVKPAVLVADGVYDDGAPQPAMVAKYVVVRDGVDGAEIWHPHHGRIQRDKRWAGHTLLTIKGSQVERTPLPAWLDADESGCTVTGNVTISDDGKYSGKLAIKLTGLFVSLGQLETTSGQKNRVQSIIDHLLPNAKLADFTLKALAPDTFEAEAKVESKKPLEKLHECYELTLAQTSPALSDVSAPVSYSQRKTAARLAGAFDERIELTLTWPEEWNVDAIPGSVEQTTGDWGSVVQTISPTEHGLKLVRHMHIARRDLPASDVLAMREPFNMLRSDHARMLLLRP